MMYTELLELTDGKATYDQFLEIEKEYMTKEDMTKEQAARLWKKRYEIRESKPLPEYLKLVKDAIRDFKYNRVYLNQMIEREEKRIDEKMAEYDPNDVWNAWILEDLHKQKNEIAYRLCDQLGNDAMIHIIYKDGSDCVVSGTEIVSGEITPRMQHIAYTTYSDGDWEYDTLTGVLTDGYTNLFGDLSTDEGMAAREEYFNNVEVKYGTEWGKKHSNMEDDQ